MHKHVQLQLQHIPQNISVHCVQISRNAEMNAKDLYENVISQLSFPCTCLSSFHSCGRTHVIILN